MKGFMKKIRVVTGTGSKKPRSTPVETEAVAPATCVVDQQTLTQNEADGVGKELMPLADPEELSSNSEEEDEDEDEDAVGDLPAIETCDRYMAKKQRHSVSAEVYGEWNKKSAFTPPVHPKSTEQEDRIKAALSKGFMFNCLDRKDITTVINAFVEKPVKLGETIITQGDDGDRLYLIESGEFDVWKILPGETDARHMCVMGVGDTVGELALLYNCPRAASVIAKTDAVLWSLDRLSFNHIVRDAAAKKRALHEDFLKEVELLKDMDPYERSKLADALRSTLHKAGEFVITEGECGDTFYIIESGIAKALKGDTQVMDYKRGDYFGELALIREQPRAASVVAETDLECISLDRKSFKRLLGPVDAILHRNAVRYNQVRTQLSASYSNKQSSLPESDPGQQSLGEVGLEAESSFGKQPSAQRQADASGETLEEDTTHNGNPPPVAPPISGEVAPLPLVEEISLQEDTTAVEAPAASK